MTSIIDRFLRDENGTVAIEYALIAALICVPIIASLKQTSATITETFNTINGAMR